MPTIRVDNDVYSWLKSLAEPFEDNPNTVLRRVASLDKRDPKSDRTSTEESNKEPRLSGKYLSRLWGVNVQHALYHVDGHFYENLKDFPGALFEPRGYVVFNTQEEYRTSPYLRISSKLNVPGGIVSIPGFKQMS